MRVVAVAVVVAVLLCMCTQALASCPALEDPSDFDEHVRCCGWPETRDGDTSTRPCLLQDGYSGALNRTCVNGTWGEVIGKCELTHCARMVKYHNTVLLRPTPIGQSDTMECNRLFNTNYLGTMTCNCSTEAKWECPLDSDVCFKGCRADGSGAKSANGVALNGDWSNTKMGETATLQCPPGYTGTVSRACPVSTGAVEFAAAVGECVKEKEAQTNNITCPGQSASPGSRYWFDETPAGQIARSPCQRPFSIVGYWYRKCLENGTWSPEIQYDCHLGCWDDKNAQSTNGVALNADWPVAHFNETKTLPCPQGYTGTVSRTCLQSPTSEYGAYGGWTAPAGYCVKEGEVSPNHCASYSAEYRVVWPDTPANQTAALSCGSIFAYHVGHKSQECLPTGHWSGVIEDTCQLGCAKAGWAFAINGVMLNFDWPEAALNKTFTQPCPEGFIGTMSTVCLSKPSGAIEWAHPVGECRPQGDVSTSCPSDKDAHSANGISLNADWPEAALDETKTLPCPKGYTGSVSRTCSKVQYEAVGSWRNVIGECKVEEEEATACATILRDDSSDLISWPETPIGQSATVPCQNLGYSSKYLGSATRACEAGGKWGDIYLDCELRCAATTEEAQSENGVKLGNPWPMTQWTLTLSMPCPDGYTGTVYRACTDHWEPVQGVCAKSGSDQSDATWANHNQWNYMVSNSMAVPPYSEGYDTEVTSSLKNTGKGYYYFSSSVTSNPDSFGVFFPHHEATDPDNLTPVDISKSGKYLAFWARSNKATTFTVSLQSRSAANKITQSTKSVPIAKSQVNKWVYVAVKVSSFSGVDKKRVIRVFMLQDTYFMKSGKLDFALISFTDAAKESTLPVFATSSSSSSSSSSVSTNELEAGADQYDSVLIEDDQSAISIRTVVVIGGCVLGVACVLAVAVFVAMRVRRSRAGQSGAVPVSTNENEPRRAEETAAAVLV